jgi:Flp pilus assembly protein TadD
MLGVKTIWSSAGAKGDWELDSVQIKTEARRLLHFGQPEQAVSLLREGLARIGADAEGHGLMGAALSRAGDDSTAVSHFERAVRLDPLRAANHYNLGVAYEKVGRLDWALEGYRQALLRDPVFEQAVTAYYRLAQQLADEPEGALPLPQAESPEH